MAEIPSIPQLYNDIQYARTFLNAASREDDPERQRSLAAIGQGFAQLAQVEATWLTAAAAEVSGEAEVTAGTGESAGAGGPGAGVPAARGSVQPWASARRIDLSGATPFEGRSERLD
jgi:hypothetical protein